jgi:adenosylcobinamide-GDP ribazoletransferase
VIERELRACAAAVSFLTRIPIGRWITVQADDVRRSGAAMPLVGAAVGAAVGATADGLADGLGSLLAAALAVALGTGLTGALHVDGLADTADALGADTRQQALVVMRDHTIGAFGAAALALDLLIKTAAVAALAARADALSAALIAGTLSRAMAVLQAARLPYARATAGAGTSLSLGSTARAVTGVGLALLIALAVGGLHGLELAAAAVAVAAALGVAWHRWIGGITGDTLGATVELVEGTVLVVAVALL